MTKQRIILGAMSGTSADGVDVAVVKILGRGLRLRAELLDLVTEPFTPTLRRKILEIRNSGKCELRELAQVGRDLTLAYATAARRAMRQTRLAAGDIQAIAAHGQTIFHSPPLTIQWFDPSLLALQTNCPVISDFRRADCALGGQGAPLVPFADYLLFRAARKNRVLLNIGGIANITWIPAGGRLEDVIAFDTGPGNCLSDAIARERLDKHYDSAGRLASSGTPDEARVRTFLRNRYFKRKAPKTTDGPEMLRAFGPLAGANVNDLLATACLCAARSIADAIKALPSKPDEIIAAGGGMRNRTFVRMLNQELQLPVLTTNQFGVPLEAREAMAFALLGAATLDRSPSNVPAVTGASRPAILGSITPRP